MNYVLPYLHREIHKYYNIIILTLEAFVDKNNKSVEAVGEKSYIFHVSHKTKITFQVYINTN